MRKPILACFVLLALFLVVAAVQKNLEFLIYAGVLVPVLLLIQRTDRLFSYREIALWGFGLWMVLHVVGGLVSVGDTRMYDFMLVEAIGEPYQVLRYDQFVHFFCYLVIAMLLSSVVQAISADDSPAMAQIVVTILAASGVGAVNEIIEFVPVVLFASDGPGGYTNTAIDIVMNFIGALAGTLAYRRLFS